MTDTMAQMIFAIGALVLVLSSLAARRLPLGQTLRLLLIWVAIFAAAFVLFLFRHEGRAIWDRATAEFSGNTGQMVGDAYRVKRSDDGHFWALGKVNGRRVRFLIDSGATSTTLSPQAAQAAGIVALEGFPVIVNTANGIAEAHRARIGTLEIGPIRQADAPILIGTRRMRDVNLLGMSFLSRLQSWRVEGGILILTP